ncbi:MAG: uroporphyrinogen-III C-methyltransferase [Cyclobacteriaceae bacterium]|nr:uroporphyrinogen-III C-methyltransferase [Cyclobacteriaceae bacterium HetDA_MAG_MS6]
MGKVFLVGAGPGDEELVTLKAIKVLKKASVVLYDALVNTDLLSYCPEGCIKEYVGKKPGIHQYQQIMIQDMLVDYANRYENVVRLKGGDPYVFGRGHEELVHCEDRGLEVEVIPGISSALAVPAMAGVPLTKRGVNESFWVITGTTSSGAISDDIPLAAQSSATVIVLMGMKNLDKIVGLFRVFRGEEEPVAIIQNGTKNGQRSTYGLLSNIEQQVIDQQIFSPAIIVIGEVVNQRRNRCFANETLNDHLASYLPL